MGTAVEIAQRPLARWSSLIAAYWAGYVLLHWAGYYHPIEPLGVTPWSPNTGLSLALLLRYGPRMGPATFGAILFGDVIVHGINTPLPQWLLASIAQAVGYTAAAVFLTRVARIDIRLQSLRDLLWFITASGVALLAIAGAYVGIYASAGLVAWPDMAVAISGFWIGDMIGIMVVTPLLLVLEDELRGPSARARWHLGSEQIAQAASVILALWLVFAPNFADDFNLFYLLFLPLIWVAMRHGIAGTTIVIAGIQIGLIIATRGAKEDFISFLEFQFLMLALAITGLFLGVVVSEGRRIRQALSETEEELNRALRLAAAGEMASALAHELNQPLSAISAYLRACQLLLGAPQERHKELVETMDKVVREAGRAAEVVKRLREFFRSGLLQCESCTAEQLVREAVQPLAKQLERQGIALKVACAPGLPRLRADRLQVGIVLHNLVGNAIDALSARGAKSGEIEIAAERDGTEAVRIRVQDSGPGVSPEILEHLFQPYATSKRDGMGLGLAISRSIVEAHGGKLWFEPAPSGGARFTLTLPADGRADTAAER